MEEKITTIQVTKAAAAEIKRLFPQLRNDIFRIDALLKAYHVVSAGVIPAPADAAPGVYPIPFIDIEVKK